MKRLTPYLLACWVLAGMVSAQAGRLVTETVSIATAGLTEGTNTTAIAGYLDTIIFDVPAGSVTGDVSVTYNHAVSTAAAVTIYTNNAVTADVVLRPRTDASAMGTGAALTGDPPVPLAIPKNGTITFTLLNGSATNLTWKLILIYEKP